MKIKNAIFIVLILIASLIPYQDAISQDLKPLRPLRPLKPLKPLNGGSTAPNSWLTELELERKRNLEIIRIRNENMKQKARERELAQTAVEFTSQKGLASWYGPGFQGKQMANGQIYDMHNPKLAAHKSLPLGTQVLVTDIRTNKSITVTITDRGPYIAGRIIDLSLAGAKKLANDFKKQGTIPVCITAISPYGFVWPTSNKTITQGLYGHGYPAIDIRGSYGTRVWSVADGQIVFSGWKNGYGNCIQIDHGAGLNSFYAHLSKRSVRAGQRVKQGQLIGLIGSTGNSTGPHLHFEILVNNKKQNPLKYLTH